MHGPEGGLMAVDKAGRHVRLVGVSYINPHDQHEHSSTTALYTCVSSDYGTTTLRKALSSTLRQPLDSGMEESEG